MTCFVPLRWMPKVPCLVRFRKVTVDQVEREVLNLALSGRCSASVKGPLVLTAAGQSLQTNDRYRRNPRNSHHPGNNLRTRTLP